MAGNTLNLSLLSRGIGQVKRNGSEKVEIKLEPEDYFNLKSDTLYLPPITSSRSLSIKRQSISTLTPRQSITTLTPRQLSSRHARSPRTRSASSAVTDQQEVHLPKTFTTRKGALLLFSEDLAGKSGQDDDVTVDAERRRSLSRSADDLSLRTLSDLAHSILAYGATADNDKINLRFVRDRVAATRRVRPGYSARRYLSRLTRSFDESFLENLMNKGYVQEKTLFQSNTLLPHLRRRINDDLSSLPPPYRILKNMLMAPGILSGYNFFRGRNSGDNDSELSMVLEEEESESRRTHKVPQDGSSIIVVDLREGAPRSVVYSKLDKTEKEKVLTDLLVKSAINHALEEQRKKMLNEGYGNMDDADTAQSVTSNDAHMTSIRHQTSHVTHHTPRQQHFDMAEAVRSYLESAVDGSAVVDHEQSTRSTLKGSKLSSHSAKSFEVHSRPVPDYQTEREYIGDIPVATFKATSGSAPSSRRSSLGDVRGSISVYQNLPTITDVDDQISRTATKDKNLNKHIVLPPINTSQHHARCESSNLSQAGSAVSEGEMIEPVTVNITPPTPQTRIHVTLPTPTPGHRLNVSEEEEEDGSRSRSESSEVRQPVLLNESDDLKPRDGHLPVTLGDLPVTLDTDTQQHPDLQSNVTSHEDIEMELVEKETETGDEKKNGMEERELNEATEQEQNIFPPSWEMATKLANQMSEMTGESEVSGSEGNGRVEDGGAGKKNRKRKLKKHPSQHSLVSTISLESGGLSLGAGSPFGSTEHLQDAGSTENSPRGSVIRGGAKKVKTKPASSQKGELSGEDEPERDKDHSDTGSETEERQEEEGEEEGDMKEEDKHDVSQDIYDDKKEDVEPSNSQQGSIVLAPDGDIINVGGQITTNQKTPSPVTTTDVNHDVTSDEPLTTAGERRKTLTIPEYRRTQSDLTYDKYDVIMSVDVEAVEDEVDGRPITRELQWSPLNQTSVKITDTDRRESGMKRGVDNETMKSLVPTASSTDPEAPSSSQQTELVHALTEHAHRIAQNVLAANEAGANLLQDAQAAAGLWKTGETLSRSQSVQDLHTPNTRVAGEEIRSRLAKSAAPTIAQYRQLLKDALVNVMSQQDNENIPADVEISPELINVLVEQQLSPADIEVIQDGEGKNVMRVKSATSHKASRRGSALSQVLGGVKEGHIYQEPPKKDPITAREESSPTQNQAQGPPRSIPAERAAETEDLGMEIINYGEAEKPEEPAEEPEQAPEEPEQAVEEEAVVEEMQVTEKEEKTEKEEEAIPSEPQKDVDSPAALSSVSPQKEETVEQEELVAPRPDTTKSSKSYKSIKSAKSMASDKKSKSSLEDREEFVVGKVDTTVELQKLYAPVEPPPSAKDMAKKPRVPPAPKVKTPAKKPETKKPEVAKKGGGKGKKGKKGKKKEAAKEEVKKEEETKVEVKEEEAPPAPVEDLPKSPSPAARESTPEIITPSPEPEPEEEEMEFIFIHDVSSESEPEPEPEPELEPDPEPESPEEEDPAESIHPSEADTETSRRKAMLDLDEEDEEKIRLKQITAQDARAAKRAAQAARKKEEVERKRKEREEQLKKEKEEQERKERMLVEIEEERRKREEAKRLERLRREEEQRRVEQEGREAERRQQQEVEREKRMKEEYAKRMDEMKKRQMEEERRRKELEEEQRREDEEKKKQEADMMAQMEEAERREYERRKKEEEERIRREEEEARVRREAELLRQMEEAKRLAEEMARQQAELEKRLQFNRSLQLESHGLGHTQDITRAFVYSYYELLQWLGLEVPDFMTLKENMPY